SLTQARLFLAGALCDIARPVLITFDDGYESLYTYALPVAKKLEAPMSVFVVTARIGRKPQFARYLSDNQIREMSESGFFEFGSHTHDLHTESTKMFEAFRSGADNPILRLLNRDLRLSSARLEGLTGRRPEAIAWPYGRFNSEFTAIARHNGFKMHFTSAAGYNEPGSNPYAIKRIPVTARDTAASVLKKVNPGIR
ncbi:MAG: polysaccharide deacetylase family protein, partial [Candidatus Riflebacteria bacterium]|nr:polysaccharide deacetylase family protein [Candidatus Riflebacteria bacterium]